MTRAGAAPAPPTDAELYCLTGQVGSHATLLRAKNPLDWTGAFSLYLAHTLERQSKLIAIEALAIVKQMQPLLTTVVNRFLDIPPTLGESHLCVRDHLAIWSGLPDGTLFDTHHGGLTKVTQEEWSKLAFSHLSCVVSVSLDRLLVHFANELADLRELTVDYGDDHDPPTPGRL